MTDEPTTTSQEADAAERDKLLHEIWCFQARAIRDILRETASGEMKASMLQSINTFLRCNDITSATIPDADRDTKAASVLSQKIKELVPEGEVENVPE